MEQKTGMKRKQSSTTSDVHKRDNVAEPVEATLQPVVLLEDFVKNRLVVEKSVSKLKTHKLENSHDDHKCDPSSSLPAAVEREVDQPVVGDSSDQVDHDLEDEVPIKVSSPQEKELRRIARAKQLEKMRVIEAAASRQQRYNKRVNSTNPIKVSSKKVKWKKDLTIYHVYSDDSS